MHLKTILNQALRARTRAGTSNARQLSSGSFASFFVAVNPGGDPFADGLVACHSEFYATPVETAQVSVLPHAVPFLFELIEDSRSVYRELVVGFLHVCAIGNHEIYRPFGYDHTLAFDGFLGAGCDRP